MTRYEEYWIIDRLCREWPNSKPLTKRLLNLIGRYLDLGIHRNTKEGLDRILDFIRNEEYDTNEFRAYDKVGDVTISVLHYIHLRMEQEGI